MDCDVTYEELAAFASDDVAPERAQELRNHAAACPSCRQRLDALARLDAGLRSLPRFETSASALLRTRRLLSEQVRGGGRPELMTLDEVAAFLRISLDELEEVVLELPAFELAGQLRVRRSRLIEWIEARERAYSRSRAETEVARIFSDTE